jgi:hypothetical protein
MKTVTDSHGSAMVHGLKHLLMLMFSNCFHTRIVVDIPSRNQNFRVLS